MSRATTAIRVVDSKAERPQSAARAIVETTKPGITRLVVITAFVGFTVAALGRSDWAVAELVTKLLGVLFGVAFAAAGANALNMWFETERDARMDRTKDRPLPSGSIRPKTVFTSGIALSVIGTLTLWFTGGPITGLLGLISIISYVLWYTPLKPITILATFVGAIPGALPPMIGAAAATDALTPWDAFAPIGIALFILMAIWQIPHFYAIAWMYRDDYGRGGMRMLPTIDRTGKPTVLVVTAFTMLLLPATLSPILVAPDRLAWAYGIFAFISWVGFTLLVCRWITDRSSPRAKAVFIGSIIHLPLLMLVMVIESVTRTLIL